MFNQYCDNLAEKKVQPIYSSVKFIPKFDVKMIYSLANSFPPNFQIKITPPVWVLLVTSQILFNTKKYNFF